MIGHTLRVREIQENLKFPIKEMLKIKKSDVKKQSRQ
jgi:hypothetical protein